MLTLKIHDRALERQLTELLEQTTKPWLLWNGIKPGCPTCGWPTPLIKKARAMLVM